MYGFQPRQWTVQRPPTASFSTTFPLTQNPISQGGIWTNGLADGVAWNDVQTDGTKALATSLASGVADSIAHLKSTVWPASAVNIRITAVMFQNAADPDSEFELHLRHLITTNNARGYECLLSQNGNVQIVRWNGAFSDFTTIETIDNLPTPTADGDVISAEITGSSIKFFQNGIQLAHATDATWANGFPGLGFDKPIAADPTKFGWKSWSVVAI